MERVVRTLLDFIRAEHAHITRAIAADKSSHSAVEDEKSAEKINKKLIQQAATDNGFTGGCISKKRILPVYIKYSREFWGVDEAVDAKMHQILQIKPRRTASGVATITVMTKPWTCSSACIYCPNDVRMPKSYLADEPVCQRALRVYFDPYLQVISRLRALKQMGHQTDKIELIVLGGTFTDYTTEYQNWFVHELFRGLNDSDFLAESTTTSKNSAPEQNQYCIIKNTCKADAEVEARKMLYKKIGLTNIRAEVDERTSSAQKKVLNQEWTYNDAVRAIYLESEAWKTVAEFQKSSWCELSYQQKLNENNMHRVVGLVIETRPDTLSARKMLNLRQLGCTKIQMGLQSLDEAVLHANARNITVDEIARAFTLLRLYGFKIHIHFMLNLFTSTADMDSLNYQKLVTDNRFLPDEIKLYPCMLVDGTPLKNRHETGEWTPYFDDDLVSLLVECTKKTPRYARISRMIRDISAHDILAGNKKSNLRQIVDAKLHEEHSHVDEIRYREVATKKIDASELEMRTHRYDTSCSVEYFLEWVTKQDLIAGFLRLSLPTTDILQVGGTDLPFCGGCCFTDSAMIREVHIYGKSVGLNSREQLTTNSSQHKGLGRKLIQEAENIARKHGRRHLRVISAVGTRDYYRKLGFTDSRLYQIKELE